MFNLNYTTIEKPEYTVINLNSYEKISAELNKSRNYVLLICLVLLPILVAGFFIISRKIFRPIREVTENIRKNIYLFGEEHHTRWANEIDFISHTFSKAIQHINTLEKKEHNNLSTMKNNFVKDLLTQKTAYEISQLEKTFEEYKININLRLPYFILVFRIDDFKSFSMDKTGNTIQLMLFSIGNIASEVIGDDFRCFPFEISDDHEVIIVNFTNSKVDLLDKVVIDRLKIVQEAVKKHLGFSTSVGVSDIGDDIIDMKNLYVQAYECTDYRIVYGKSQIINSRNLLKRKKGENTTNIINNLVSSIKSGNKDKFTCDLENILKDHRDYSYKTILDTFSKLIFEISKITKDLSSASKEDKALEYLDAYNKIKEFENLEELKEYILQLFDNFYLIVESINNRGINEIIKDIISYINENYANCNISANLVSEKFSITPQYFSKYFNEYTGESFPHYLMNLRLEKAKELLKTTNLHTTQIGQRVGYMNRAYFTTLFKKEIGVSPSKYRLNINN